ncbi:MFS transporter [Arthrobacter sp. OAP107]|uniref:MFS transporter n=1 Tax=Arthrobacter sp. OAP107 TaxID=3156445 RepID=UPI003397B68E
MMTSLTTKSSGLGELGDRTLRKVRRRVMPLIVLLYFIAYLDRNNVGFAKLTMSEDIGLTAAAYGLGAGIFFLGYAVLEIPSNAGMYKFGARKWLARILITWGIFAAAMALVNGESTYFIIRFLLGAAEAGFFPRHPLLPDPLVPRRTARHRAGHLHPGPAHLQRTGGTCFRPAPPDGRRSGPARLAVALHH